MNNEILRVEPAQYKN